jgi:molybdate transport system substrate-binding protein
MRDAFIALLFIILGCRHAFPNSIQSDGGGSGPDTSANLELAVAAPGALNDEITEVARTFEHKTGIHIRLTFADSGTLDSQIRNGGVFDAFFSADMDHPRRLAASGAAVRASVTEYARDQLVLCVSPAVRVGSPPGDPLLLLTNKAISHVAIADPKPTVSGSIAEETIRRARIYDIAVRRKLLIGDDDSQVAQYIRNGNADIALLPMTAARVYELWGTRMIPIAQNLYPPMRMGALVVTHSKHHHEALEFLRFAASPDGRTIFRRSGF